MASMVSTGLSLASMLASQQQTREQDKAQNERAEAQSQYLLQQQAVEDKQRRDLLHRQLAAQRSRLAASGLGVGAGSGQALLAGMVKDSENAVADAQGLTQARLNATHVRTDSAAGGLLGGLTTAHQAWGLFNTGFGSSGN